MYLRRLRPLFFVLVLLLAFAQAEAAPPSARQPSTLEINNMAAQSGANADASSRVAVPVPTGANLPAASTLSAGKEYVLGADDEIKLVVYGEEDLSGQYLVGSSGIVALPLIGPIDAAGHTIKEFEEAVRAKLANGYLKDPRVSVEVANYRPFFILGEVTKPGSYPYVNGMSVLNAIALAGGYTYRADHGDIKIVHANDPQKTEQKITEDAVVMPGDIIKVSERFF